MIDIDVVIAQELADAELFGWIVFDDQQTLAPRQRILANTSRGRIQSFGRSSAW